MNSIVRLRSFSHQMRTFRRACSVVKPDTSTLPAKMLGFTVAGRLIAVIGMAAAMPTRTKTVANFALLINVNAVESETKHVGWASLQMRYRPLHR